MGVQVDPWDTIELDPTDVKQLYNQNPNKDAWDQVEVDETWGKTLARYLMQVPSGIAQAFTWPADVLKMMGQADIEDPEEIQRLRMIAEREGMDPDEFEQKYFEGAEAALEMFPTQHRLENLAEEATGIPFEAKTRGQKALRFASTSGKMAPKGMTLRGSPVKLPKPVIGAGLAGVKETAQELGVPEPIAEIGSFLALKKAPEGMKELSGIAAKRKPSGMTERRFENVKSEKTISAEKHKQISEKLEKDFRGILDDIVESSPMGETQKEISSNPKFKQEIEKKFEKVQDLSSELPEKFSSNDIKDSIIQKIKNVNVKGISPSEYEESYSKFLGQFAGKIKNKELVASDLVDQFRKNNKTLGEIFESGKSGAFNRAKKDAYLDYNRIIAKKIEQEFPKSEFSELFKESNMQWSKIKDAEFVESFIDDMFEGKVDFKKGVKAFDKKVNEQFKKALGKEQYQKFETLMEDLLSTKEAYSKLKIAKDKGFANLAKISIPYLIHPKLAMAKVGKDIVKGALDSLLDKPKFALHWKEGVNAFKKGDFAKAEAKFILMNSEIKSKN